ncbi:MAG: hypothetical protein LBG99_09285 [Propionibacteriaceae bacterium]|jgi:hypothetical protein|nr:hypothetical protein [Propionibacteriaceae bacterium]
MNGSSNHGPVRKFKRFGWVFYIGDDSTLAPDKTGKWMYFFNNLSFVRDACERAVANGVVVEAKHSDASRGVACFYLNSDDIAAHRKTITFFLENNLIRRTKSGRLYDISFKLDSQTEAGEYAGGFHSDTRLSTFLDLNTAEWINLQPE